MVCDMETDVTGLPKVKNHKGISEVFSRQGYHACVGSGYCCSKAPCSLASQKYGDRWTSPCPSLVEANGRFWCGELLNAPEHDKERVAALLHIGAGCCSSMNTFRKDLVAQILRGERKPSGEVSDDRDKPGA